MLERVQKFLNTNPAQTDEARYLVLKLWEQVGHLEATRKRGHDLANQVMVLEEKVAHLESVLRDHCIHGFGGPV